MNNKNYVIAVNGGYFDGLQGGKSLEEAKRFDRSTAQAVNRLVMCGNGKIKKIS